MQIAVVGSDIIDGKVEKTAEQVGSEIAKAGAVLICGGKEGVMKAVCRGAKSAGGTTIGILPESENEANEYVDIKIPTGLGYLRNSIIARSCDAMIAISGSMGTLTEIIYAVTYKKPVILLQGTGGIVDHFDKLEELPEIKQKIQRFEGKILKAKSAKEAVELALGQP